MRSPAEREIKKDVILRKCFECLTEKGIEAITIKDFSDSTGMSMSSIYYWFEDKDEIVLDAVEWGLDENVKILFDFAFRHTDNLTKLCEGIKELAMEYKKQFRLIFQVATSPQYGGKVRKLSSKLDFEYKRYTEILSERLTISYDLLYPFVNLFVSSFVDCVMWDSWDKFDMEMKSIITVIGAVANMFLIFSTSVGVPFIKSSYDLIPFAILLFLADSEKNKRPYSNLEQG